MQTLKEIRAQFLNYFGDRDHRIAPSSALVPDDPTLLFTNAGMVQFKDIFTGGAPAPKPPRATTSQKCVRAGGKHNDLDNVGYTARHHTFFEMLGNFSFGDYFKDEAIAYAWELITKEFGLPADRLIVTTYVEDDEAARIWKKVAGLADDRIIPISGSDNFWSMGDTGPCGPCSEIFYDHGDHIFGGPPGSPDEDGDRFVEIWNLVFMQYEMHEDGRRSDLPKPSIDTGMGLERMAAVLQGVTSNYDVDLFKTLIAASVEIAGEPTDEEARASHRVIADHLRACSFLIADGVTPSNEGRGYVLRRIMRRAMRHAHLLGVEEPLMHRLAPTLADEMGEAFPELVRAQPAIVETLRQEEVRFRRTLANGVALLESEAAALKSGDTLPGAVAFKLYDTYGFPLDLTEDALKSRGVGVDTKGFEAEMERQREGGRASWTTSGAKGADADWRALSEGVPATEFLGYQSVRDKGGLVLIAKDGESVDSAGKGDEVELVFDRTPFYGESGGQIGDTGEAVFKKARAIVLDTQKRGEGLYAHRARIEKGEVKIGDKAELIVDRERRDQTRANHSATHLMHAALRNVLGPHVTQKGSYVGPDRLRFDFSHGQPLSADELRAIEDEVNAVIRQNDAACTEEMAPDKAIEAGALALFGEKYGDSVRVLTLGRKLSDLDKAYSVELCGGTHVARTGDIALFKIIAESAVGAGVRRIEAMTGAAAKAWLDEQAGIARKLSETLKTRTDEAVERLDAVLKERKALERALADAKKQLALGGGGAGGAEAPEEIAGVKAIVRVADGVGGKDLRALIDQGKQELGSGVVAYVGVTDGKAALAVGVTDDLKDAIDARALVQAGAKAVGGKGGGGRPDMAQAGGPDGAKAADAVAAIKTEIEKARAATA